MKSGMFGLSLGSAVPIPEAILGRRGQWLEIEVRGPAESDYATLSPRQLLSLGGLTAPSSPSADAACAHDHIGETWNATANWSLSGFKINNNGTGPAIWVVNSGGGNALRGDGYGTSVGVFGEGANAPGIVGHGISSDGVEGNSDGDAKSGVYGHHEGNNFGYGVYGISNNGRGVQAFDGGPEPDDSYAVYAVGDILVTDDLTVDDTLNVFGYASFSGGKTGFVVDVAQNDESIPLQSGDLVAISGFGEPVLGEIPVIKVRRASAGELSAVVGVVDKHFVPSEKPTLGPEGVETKLDYLYEAKAVQPGEYLTIVTLGSYKAIKVDASYGAVLPGSLLVASPNPGYAMAAENPKPGTIVGKALGSLASGVGSIPVMVTLQ